MKKVIFTLSIILVSLASNATIHVVRVWDGYFQFLSQSITIELGDTVQWLPLDQPMMVHTITSTNIPAGAASFDQIWQAPVDTFFQYVPQVVGLYEYECTPHVVQFGMQGSINVIPKTIGIDEGELSVANVQVYPNPATDFIRFNKSEIGCLYNVYTISGNLVWSGITEEMVSVSNLADGIYHIEILGDKLRVMKMVKQ